MYDLYFLSPAPPSQKVHFYPTPLFPLLLPLLLPPPFMSFLRYLFLPPPPSHYIKLGHARQRTRFGGFFFQSSFPARSRVQRRRPTYTAILALRHICCRRDSAALHRPVAPCPTFRSQRVWSGLSRPIPPWLARCNGVLARCNASFPRSRASLPLPRTVCPCPPY